MRADWLPPILSSPHGHHLPDLSHPERSEGTPLLWHSITMKKSLAMLGIGK